MRYYSIRRGVTDVHNSYLADITFRIFTNSTTISRCSVFTSKQIIIAAILSKTVITTRNQVPTNGEAFDLVDRGLAADEGEATSA